MAEAVIGKRPFHTFLSHAHVDRDRADEIFQFLNDVAGIPVWYDAVNLPPGATIADNLYEAIESSRSAMILLSRTSVQRGWVQQELRAALNQQALHRDFRIVPLRLDDVEPPTSSPAIATCSSVLTGSTDPRRLIFSRPFISPHTGPRT